MVLTEKYCIERCLCNPSYKQGFNDALNLVVSAMAAGATFHGTSYIHDLFPATKVTPEEAERLGLNDLGPNEIRIVERPNE